LGFGSGNLESQIRIQNSSRKFRQVKMAVSKYRVIVYRLLAFFRSVSGESAATLQPFFTLQLDIQHEVNYIHSSLGSVPRKLWYYKF
jgi:hypothetical protein